jgi:hypothetical protein
MRRIRHITNSLCIALVASLVMLTSPIPAHAAPDSAEHSEPTLDSPALTRLPDGKINLAAGAALPRGMPEGLASDALTSLNEHIELGHVVVSSALEFDVTPRGRQWAIQQVRDVFGACHNVTSVRASWLGLIVESRDGCSDSRPQRTSSAPPTVGPDTGGHRGNTGVAGSGPTVASSSAEGPWFDCALSLLGWALSAYAFVKSTPFSPGWWASVAAFGITTYLSAKSCFSIYWVWVDKRNGARYADWLYDGDWVWDWYDQRWVPRYTQWDGDWNEYV